MRLRKCTGGSVHAERSRSNQVKGQIDRRYARSIGYRVMDRSL